MVRHSVQTWNDAMLNTSHHTTINNLLGVSDVECNNVSALTVDEACSVVCEGIANVIAVKWNL